LIRDEFLNAHPATLLWWEQREKCRACNHMLLNGASLPVQEMRCYAIDTRAPVARPRGRPATHPYCIDARLPDGLCGPEARCFEPRDDE
jgi:hypothetical protein